MKSKSGLEIYNRKLTDEGAADIYGIFASVVLCVGCILTVSGGFESLAEGVIIYCLLGAALSVGILYLLNSKIKGLIPAVVAAICIAWGLLFSGKIKSGIASLGNDYLTWLTTADATIHLDYLVEDEKGIVFVGILLCITISFLCSLSAKRREILPVLPLLILIAFGCGIGFVPMRVGAAVMFLGLIFLLAYIIQAKDDSTGFAKRLMVQVGIIIMCVLLSMSTLILPEGIFEVSMAETAKAGKHAEEYHISTPSMPEGELNNLGAWEKSATAALRMSMEEPQKMYLKGMVGDVYTGTSWEGFDAKDLAEYEDEFYWLHKYGYFSQSSISGVTDLVNEDTEEFLMQITSIGACREYTFVPYALSGNDILDDTLIGDSSVFASEETGSVSYKYTAGSVPEWYLTQNALAAMQAEDAAVEYLRHEESYRDFVYKNYLQLTNESIGALDRLLGADKKQQRTLAEIRKSIFDTLEEHLAYDETAVTKNGGNDFFRYFMEQTKSGYSVHYATAAVLMLRYYGVPARYVEGYFLSAEDANEYEPSETIVLDESHAHAWAEYYLDGIGWIPFEVTPGYVDDEELQLSNEVVSNQQIYDQNELKYTPPIQQEERTPLSNWRDFFAIKKEHIIAFVIIILLAFIIRAVFRRRKLKEALEKMNTMENKEAITSVYGYAVMLLDKVNGNELPDESQVRLINQEAMFSTHQMTDEQRDTVVKYTEDVKALCRNSWKWWEKIKYKFIECIYL